MAVPGYCLAWGRLDIRSSWSETQQTKCLIFQGQFIIIAQVYYHGYMIDSNKY